MDSMNTVGRRQVMALVAAASLPAVSTAAATVSWDLAPLSFQLIAVLPILSACAVRAVGLRSALDKAYPRLGRDQLTHCCA